jgi:hypothetical protein
MDRPGDLNDHLREDTNTSDPDVNVSDTPDGSPLGGSMGDALVDQTRNIIPETSEDPVVDDEAHRDE